MAGAMGSLLALVSSQTTEETNLVLRFYSDTKSLLLAVALEED